MSAELAESSIDDKRVLKKIPPRKVRSKKRGGVHHKKNRGFLNKRRSGNKRSLVYIRTRVQPGCQTG
jgi:hypothetical protein